MAVPEAALYAPWNSSTISKRSLSLFCHIWILRLSCPTTTISIPGCFLRSRQSRRSSFVSFSSSVTRYLQLFQNRAHNHIDTCLNADIAAACEHVSYLLYRIDPAQYISVWGRPSWSWVKDTIPDEPFAGFQVAGGPVLVDTPIPQLVPLEEDPELLEDDEDAERPSLAGAVPPRKSFQPIFLFRLLTLVSHPPSSFVHYHPPLVV